MIFVFIHFMDNDFLLLPSLVCLPSADFYSWNILNIPANFPFLFIPSHVSYLSDDWEKILGSPFLPANRFKPFPRLHFFFLFFFSFSFYFLFFYPSQGHLLKKNLKRFPTSLSLLFHHLFVLLFPILHLLLPLLSRIPPKYKPYFCPKISCTLPSPSPPASSPSPLSSRSTTPPRTTRPSTTTA